MSEESDARQAESAPPSGGGALVVWTSAGARMLFRKEDLVMPESLKSHKDLRFFEKQWPTVCGFWITRVHKEERLQELSIPQLIQRVVDDIQRRLDKKKQEKQLHNRKKRLLQGKGGAAASHGTPSEHILLTNIISLEAYLQEGSEGQTNLISEVVAEVARVAKVPLPLESQVLIDNNTSPCSTSDHAAGTSACDDGDLETAPPPLKAPRHEQEDPPGPSAAPIFDDRLAVVVRLPTVDAAASAVAAMSGNSFDGRRVVCHFYSKNQ
jgi:hypothetical protein